MSFYSEASLAYVASAGASKDGKAYSMKPVDGTGDFTFSRGSNLAATRVGPTGLIEKGRENLLTQSNTFSSTDWNNERFVSPIQTGFTGYDGSSDAWKLIPTTDNNTHRISQLNSQTGVKTFSVYLKESGYSKVRILAFQGNNNIWEFDLNAGVTIGAPSYAIEYKAANVGNDWWRLQLTSQEAHTAYYVFVLDDLGNLNFAGDGVKGVLIQDAQLEIGLAATEVISTGATTGKAGLLEDEPRFDYSGGATCPSLLLEPSRTNLVRLSEAVTPGSYGWTLGSGTTLTLNDAISPEGVKNAFRLDIPTAINTTLVRCNVLESTQYTFSFYVKRGTATELKYSVFNFSTLGNIVATTSYFSQTNTNDFVRIVVPFTTPVGCTDVGVYLDRDSGANGSAWFYGIQVEAGSYPTSYIPNHSGGTITRGDDDASNTGTIDADNDFTFYFESTLMAEYFTDKYFNSTNFGYLSGYNISGNNLRHRFGGTNYGFTAPEGVFKYLIRKDSTNMKIYLNGTLERTITTLPTGTGDLNLLGGKVHKTLYFPEALSDADCITLTT